MKFKSGFSLQAQFIALTTLAIVMLMGIIGYLTVKREEAILRKEAVTQGKVLGETLAIPIINDLIYERLGLVEEGGLLDNYIMEIFNRKDVDLLYIAILDEEGSVISHNNISEYGKKYTDTSTLASIKSEKTTINYVSYEGIAALDFGVPLSISKKRWGTLKFAISLKNVEEETKNTIAKIGVITLIFLVGGFVIILFLSRRFIGPITNLANIMEKASGDYLDVKVEVKGSDELAILGDRFNSMIERIKQANEEIKRTHEKLIKSEKLASIGILAAGVAHEINNPLGGLFNCLQMLKQNGDSPAFREKYLGLIGEGLERIEGTVSKLLWMARKGEHNPVGINIKSAVDNTYSLIEYKSKRAGISFLNHVDEDAVVVMDLHDFQQAMLNLFINAVHAMPEGGTLSVDAHKNDSKIIIEVADTGLGICKEHIGKIFDPFFTTKPVGEGTGLGLWLTYEIVRSYNGEIAVQSRTGSGSVFALTFPE
jgi:signal transduction histidine kinase